MLALSPPRPILPAKAISPLKPKSQAQTFKPTIPTKTHLANLERILQKQAVSPAPPLPPKPSKGSNSAQPQNSNPILNALTLPPLFPRPAASVADEMSPRSLTHLRWLLSEAPRSSPRNPIAGRWRQFHGANDWHGMLDPLNEDLRRELVRYGDLVQSAYHAFFHSAPAVNPSQPRQVPLPDRNYRVVRNLFATSSLNLPEWVPGAEHRSSWIGYVAVCDNEQEISRQGRRDIVIALRGTATSHEWAENFRCDLVPIKEEDESNGTTAAEATCSTNAETKPNPLYSYFRQSNNKTKKVAKVERGFWSLFKTAGEHVPSLSAAVVEEVRKLIEQYKGEELSITVTGHSLGAALAVLVADEISTCAPHVPPVAVFSFGGPRVGNGAFADRVERRGVKVLRVVNAHDVITRVPVLPHVTAEGFDSYAHVGRELRVDSRISPYLRPNADPACCHDLEAYLHLVDGFMGSDCPFRSNAKRSLFRLLNQQGSNLKQKYVSTARKLELDPVRSINVQGCLASPS